MLLLELKKEKDNITNEERGQISLRLFNDYRDINGIWKKSTLMKCLHSYYGIERGDELLNDFWNNSHILLGEKDCVVKIVFTNDFPVNNFIKFLNKTKPQLKIELKEIQEFNKIDELKHMYLSTIALENATYTLSLENQLTENELNQLEEIRLSMTFGKYYCVEHYHCEVCKGHDENYPWHLEFTPKTY